MKGMAIQSVVQQTANTNNTQGKASKVEPGFGDVLQKTLESYNSSYKESKILTEGLVSGQHANIHETMIAMEKAGIQLRLIAKIQNKVVEAYKEIMRLQV